MLRFWSACGLGASDLGWRVLGLLLGIGLLGVLWLNARRFGLTVPLLGLVLLEFNDLVIIYGDSIRGFGLGSALGLLTMGAVWSVVWYPGAARSLWAFVLALLSIHVMLQDSVVLLAAGLGGMAVSLRRRRWGAAALIAAIGLVCGVSLLVYVPAFRRAAEWNVILKFPVDLAWIWERSCVTTASMGLPTTWLWLIAWVLGAAGVVGAHLPPIRSSVNEEQREAALFCGVTLTVGLPCHLLFLKMVSYFIQPWYFIITMVLVSGCLEGSLAIFGGWKAWRVIRLAAAAGLAMILFWPAFTRVEMQMTNMDQIAIYLNREARQGDVLVANPWYYAVSLQRYYSGKAELVTVPPMEDHKLHRYDLVKQHMMRTDSMKPLIDRLTKCLKNGHRAWVIGDLLIPPVGQEPPEVPQVPTAYNGWHEDMYLQIWSLQIGGAFRSYARTLQSVPIAEGQANNPYEHPTLYLLEGGRGD